ncbi:hypothetical protein AB6A40_008013 [Gnathostoma spinigerum]|uniref:Transposase n=1 Tax=Gnathostoma spinigerum TaxID=75299 RepID=A0ABD6EVL9_9BILA
MKNVSVRDEHSARVKQEKCRLKELTTKRYEAETRDIRVWMAKGFGMPLRHIHRIAKRLKEDSGECLKDGPALRASFAYSAAVINIIMHLSFVPPSHKCCSILFPVIGSPPHLRCMTQLV